jgi:cytochrome b6
MMVLMMILHVFRVYLTGGFKKPHELTWVIGVILAVLTVSFGVTGYSLPWDQIGYWAIKIVTSVPEAILIIGFPPGRVITWKCWCGSIHIDSFL